MKDLVDRLARDAQQYPDSVSREIYIAQSCAGNKELERLVRAKIALDRADSEVRPGSVEMESPSSSLDVEVSDLATRDFDHSNSMPIPSSTTTVAGGTDPSSATVSVSGADGSEELDFSAADLPRREIDVDSMVGPYRIVRKIAAGGFGVVYHALQTVPVRRDVALKVMKRGMDSEQFLARFQAERQTLAMMDHANIAKIFDAGTAETGQPFFAMELVRGVPINEYCDRKKLSIQQRIALFIDVCKAIQHAHHKGVIHRDIKPSNILVQDIDGVAKPVVIDFGVAKAFQRSMSDAPVITHMMQVIGTPAYMSPEQAGLAGIDVDSRADVYSLGMVLYELICGCVAIDNAALRVCTPQNIGQVLDDYQIKRPSARFHRSEADVEKRASVRQATPAELMRKLTSELDWIVLKCLEKDRNNRYETANGLAQELTRYLNHEPVSAHRPSFLYSFSKFATRYRGQVIAAGLVLSTLMIGLVFSLYMYWTAERRASEVLLLSDLTQLVQLKERYDGLTQVQFNARASEMDKWLEDTKEPIARYDDHKRALERLESAGSLNSDGNVTFVDQRLQWQYDNQKQLLNTLNEFVAPVGMVASVEKLRSACPTMDQMNQAWEAFGKYCQQACPRYTILRREGLYPLGMNPQTDLWEFVDLTTGIGPSDLDLQKIENSPNAAITYVFLLGGEFGMGSPETEEGRKQDEPFHEVEVSPFFIAKYEITQAQWGRLMESTPKTEFKGPQKPIGVTWFAAKDFCDRIGAVLPTEAQWEFACRGGTNGPFSSSQSVEEIGWFDFNSKKILQPIGLKLANPYGLFDMHGNAMEWVADRYDEDFYLTPEASLLDPINVPNSSTHAEFVNGGFNERAVLRGGTFQGPPKFARSADRFNEQMYIELSAFGFRPALSKELVVGPN